jgi:hypothetical protein
MTTLIVREKFRAYEKGAHIEDEDTVKSILASPDRANVIPINLPSPPPQPPLSPLARLKAEK